MTPKEYRENAIKVAVAAYVKWEKEVNKKRKKKDRYPHVNMTIYCMNDLTFAYSAQYLSTEHIPSYTWFAYSSDRVSSKEDAERLAHKAVQNALSRAQEETKKFPENLAQAKKTLDEARTRLEYWEKTVADSDRIAKEIETW